MAATESTGLPPVEAGKPSAAGEEKVEKGVEKLSKVEKPDDDKFKKDLAEAEKQLSAVSEKMVLSLMLCWCCTAQLSLWSVRTAGCFSRQLCARRGLCWSMGRFADGSLR